MRKTCLYGTLLSRPRWTACPVQIRAHHHIDVYTDINETLNMTLHAHMHYCCFNVVLIPIFFPFEVQIWRFKRLFYHLPKIGLSTRYYWKYNIWILQSLFSEIHCIIFHLQYLGLFSDNILWQTLWS